MSKINKEIEDLAKSMEEQTTTPEEKIKAEIEKLGPEGLKKAFESLSEDEREVLVDFLAKENEVKKSKAMDNAASPKIKKPKVTELVQELKESTDEDDEELVKEENKDIKPQGDNTPEGFEGQVIKADSESEDDLEKGRGPDRKPRKRKGTSMRVENPDTQSEQGMKLRFANKTTHPKHKQAIKEHVKTLARKRLTDLKNESKPNLTKSELVQAILDRMEETGTEFEKAQAILTAKGVSEELVKACTSKKVKAVAAKEAEKEMDEHEKEMHLQKKGDKDLKKGRGPDKAPRKRRDSYASEEKGVHSPMAGEGGMSAAGFKTLLAHKDKDLSDSRATNDKKFQEKVTNDAKDMHRKKLAELKEMPKPNLTKSDSFFYDVSEEEEFYKSEKNPFSANQFGRGRTYKAEEELLKAEEAKATFTGMYLNDTYEEDLKKSTSKEYDVNDAIAQGTDFSEEDIKRITAEMELQKSFTPAKPSSFDEIAIAKSLGYSDEEIAEIFKK